MDINRIIEIADGAYPDGALACHWDKKNKAPRKVPLHGMSDGLARFICVEIAETYDDDCSDNEQLEIAAAAVERASEQCHVVQNALLDEAESADVYVPETRMEIKALAAFKRSERRSIMAEKLQAIVDRMMEKTETERIVA